VFSQRARRTVKKSLLAAFAVPAILLTGALSTAANAATTGTTKTAGTAATAPSLPRVGVPTKGAMLGAYVDLDGKWTTNTAAQNEVTTIESAMGRKFAIDHHFYSWTNTFPTALERWDVTSGRTPMVTWEAFGTTLDQIANGSQDSVIAAHADAMKAFASPIFLRFGHEMNGNWYPWDGTHNNTSATTTDGPAKYRAAYQRVHDIFVARGATNVSWVWCVNAEDLPKTTWNHWTNYYPGDAYVDWVSVDAYNLGTSSTWSTWSQLAAMIDPVYRDYAARKPLMIAEAGSVEDGGDKGAWFRTAATTLAASYPAVKAVVVFDAPVWNLQSSTNSWSGFKTLAASPNFAATATS
jgi:endoglucanase